MRDWVRGLPDGDGCFHAANGEKFDALATRLVDWGLTEDEARDVLEDAYHTTADEFGA